MAQRDAKRRGTGLASAAGYKHVYGKAFRFSIKTKLHYNTEYRGIGGDLIQNLQVGQDQNLQGIQVVPFGNT